MNITAVTEVKNMLDLEREATAWNYVRRYAVQEAKTETLRALQFHPWD